MPRHPKPYKTWKKVKAHIFYGVHTLLAKMYHPENPDVTLTVDVSDLNKMGYNIPTQVTYEEASALDVYVFVDANRKKTQVRLLTGEDLEIAREKL